MHLSCLLTNITNHAPMVGSKVRFRKGKKFWKKDERNKRTAQINLGKEVGKKDREKVEADKTKCEAVEPRT